MHRHRALATTPPGFTGRETRDHPFRYPVYGLLLACNVPLDAPGVTRVPLDASAGPADVLVDLVGVTADGEQSTVRPGPPAHGSQLIVEPTGGWLAVSPLPRPEGDWTRLRFGYASHHVQFEVAPDGARTVGTWTKGIPPAYVGTLLVSTVIGFLLHIRQRITMHASVVAWSDSAFVFAGAQGAGKSTTVSALIQRGCTGVSDDIAALVAQPGAWAAFPGPAGARLTPQTLAALRIPAASVAPVWPRSPALLDVDYRQIEEKAVVTAGETSQLLARRGPLPVAGIFLLAPRNDRLAAPRATPVRPAAAVPILASNLLRPAWLERTLDQKRFLALGDLASCTPVRLVERPDTLDALPPLCDALLADMERLRR